MNCLTNQLYRAVAAAIIMSLTACNNYNLLSQLETPGTASGNTGGFVGSGGFMYVFANSTPLTGSFGGRIGADGVCLTARNNLVFPDNRCNLVRGIVSVSVADSIANMQGNYGIPPASPIHTATGFVIANNWSDLITGNINDTLASQAVMSGGINWWSMSVPPSVDFDTNFNCNGGTDGTAMISGTVGSPTATGSGFYSSSAQNCSISAHILCICY